MATPASVPPATKKVLDRLSKLFTALADFLDSWEAEEERTEEVVKSLENHLHQLIICKRLPPSSLAICRQFPRLRADLLAKLDLKVDSLLSALRSHYGLYEQHERRLRQLDAKVRRAVEEAELGQVADDRARADRPDLPNLVEAGSRAALLARGVKVRMGQVLDHVVASSPWPAVEGDEGGNDDDGDDDELILKDVRSHFFLTRHEKAELAHVVRMNLSLVKKPTPERRE